MTWQSQPDKFILPEIALKSSGCFEKNILNKQNKTEWGSSYKFYCVSLNIILSLPPWWLWYDTNLGKIQSICKTICGDNILERYVPNYQRWLCRWGGLGLQGCICYVSSISLMFEFYIMNKHCFCNQGKKSIKNEKEEILKTKTLVPLIYFKRCTGKHDNFHSILSNRDGRNNTWI